MGLFSKKKKSSKVNGNNQQDRSASEPLVSPSTQTGTCSNQNQTITSSLSLSNLKLSRKKNVSTAPSSPTAVATPPPAPPTMELIPSYLNTIQNEETCSESSARALRMLFSLSESIDLRENMVLDYEAFIPTLLHFTKRCEQNSSEQYLALLVLNNVSIPVESKGIIAIEYKAVFVLCRLLCDDPSSHLIAIILVNLTFADAGLRKELVSRSVQLVDALAYALWVSCATPEEQHERNPIVPNEGQEKLSPRELMSKVMDQDFQNKNNAESESAVAVVTAPFDSSRLLYPETARWCLCAIKNLTRPSKDSLAVKEVCRTGIIPFILRIIRVDEECNSPCTWEANTVQDAALFTLLNLSTYSSIRSVLRKESTVDDLVLITNFLRNRLMDNESLMKLAQFQRLKARMALSYILASDHNNFGQVRCRTPLTIKDQSSLLHVAHEEVQLFLELLANVLHQRSKEGVGGYSAATFTIKGVIHSIRCLLTNYINQCMFASARLNMLLFKALAMFVIQRIICVDAETAEHLCFSLYLLSDFGFRDSFLPMEVNGVNLPPLLQKLMYAYLLHDNVTDAGEHAANQILLRCDYLIFQGSASDLNTIGLYSTEDTDYSLEDDLIAEIDKIVVKGIRPGMRPMPTILDRPILRCRVPDDISSPLEDKTSFVEFHSALAAAQNLSFGTLKVQTLDTMDEICIANNIANSANGDTDIESYNYCWIWKDNANDNKFGTESSLLGIKSRSHQIIDDDDGPVSIFGMKCGVCQQSNY